jgi:type IV pilus assembly protein PilM
VAQIIEGVIDSIAAEIQRSLDFFMATSGEAEISRIFVTGGTAKIPHLAKAIERRARVAVEIFSPVEKIAIDATSVDRAAIAPIEAQLTVALGLAMRKDKEKRS